MDNLPASGQLIGPIEESSDGLPHIMFSVATAGAHLLMRPGFFVGGAGEKIPWLPRKNGGSLPGSVGCRGN